MLWRDTLVRMALNSIQDPPDVSMIVGYILVIPTPGMLRRTPYDHAINKSNSAGDMSTWDTGVQEYRSSGLHEFKGTKCLIAV